MKLQIGIRTGLAALLCLGTATLAGAQTSRAFIPNPVTGRQIIPQPSGGFGNGFNSGFGFGMGQSGIGFGTGQVLPNAANGFNPFAAMMSAGGIGAAFPNGLGLFNIGLGSGNGGFYGGYYGFGDPTIAVTPYGPVPIGNGYNGYTGGSGPSDWDVARAIYAQGYQDAANTAAIIEAEGTPAYPSGMTATPRGAIARVPHGSDGARVWRVGNGQVAVRWQGDSRIASSVTVSVTDRAGRALRSTTLTQLPAEVHFTPPSNAVFYQVVVHYVDGANNTIMGRLP